MFTLINIKDIIVAIADIFIVALIIYALLHIVRSNEKTLRIFKGTIIIIAIDATARLLGFETLLTITQNLITWGFLAFIIIFQPEIRVFLERIGKTGIRNYRFIEHTKDERVIKEISDAVVALAAEKIGAIISIERGTDLNEYIDNGVVIDAEVKKELLRSIFVPSTPLHDGAVIIQGSKIACASTYFPPTTREVDQFLGSRHRAAIGISEITDSLTIVVSEETGAIRIVQNGTIMRVTPNHLFETLTEELLHEEGDDL